ncbi:MAG: hypothetical protein AAF806_04845 [Bacteroidota bacterium]
MKLSIFLLFGFLFFTVNLSFGQSPATSKGASLISGTVNFNSTGNEATSTRNTNLGINPSYSYFLLDKFAVGADLSITYSRFSEDFSSTGFGVGPKAFYFFDSGNPMIPYLTSSLNFTSIRSNLPLNQSNDLNAWNGGVGAGIALRQSHLAILIEAGLRFSSIKPAGSNFASNTNSLFLSVGLAGFLFQENE